MLGRLLALVLLCTTVVRAADDTRPLVVRDSRATFSVQHVLIERVTGEVPIVAASVTFAPDGKTPTAVEATLDPAHLDTGDEDRDGDLMGIDWFDTKKFPRWTFKSERVVVNSDGTYSVAGILTIHGVGVPVTLAALPTHHGARLGFHATTTVDRHAFGMAVTRADALIGNVVDIVIDAELH